MRKLFYNGDILTMESPCPAEAVLTEGERILAVGDLSAIAPLAGRGAQIIDLQGGALLPGFADNGCSFWSAVWRRLPVGISGRAARAVVHEVWEEYLLRGYTAIAAGRVTAEGVKLLAHADLPYPIPVLAELADLESVLRAAAQSRGRVRVQGIWLDLDAREDGDEATGRLAYCDRAVSYALRVAAASGLRPFIRAESGAAAEQFLRVARALSRVCPALPATRPVLCDARALSPLWMEELRRLGCIPCFAADVIPRMGDDIMAARGPESAARLTPYAAARRAGLPYTLCGMRAGEIPDPIAQLSAAVCRRTSRGILLGGGERAGVYDALRALTVHGAWQDHAERTWGSIRAGMRADLVLLDRSPLAVPSASLSELRPVATCIMGELFWRELPQEISTRKQRVPSVYR